MVKWFCCSAFCTNNFRTRNPQGELIKFYRLPRDPEVQASYTRILQTTGINWHSGYICVEHWSRGYRENASADVPDIPVLASQLLTLEKKLKQAEAQLERKATKPAKRKVSSLERKLFLAKRSLRSKRFRAFRERRTGFSAFCPRENWGESKKARSGVGEGKEGNACNQTPRF